MNKGSLVCLTYGDNLTSRPRAIPFRADIKPHPMSNPILFWIPEYSTAMFLLKKSPKSMGCKVIYGDKIGWVFCRTTLVYHADEHEAQ